MNKKEIKKNFYVDVNDIRPSQLYINQAKLGKLSSTDLNRPIPLKEIDNNMIMTDGHSRAVYAINNGRSAVLAEWDDDELDWEAYKICVKWCKEKKIFSPYDLVDRVISDDEFNHKWLMRCKELHKSSE